MKKINKPKHPTLITKSKHTTGRVVDSVTKKTSIATGSEKKAKSQFRLRVRAKRLLGGVFLLRRVPAGMQKVKTNLAQLKKQNYSVAGALSIAFVIVLILVKVTRASDLLDNWTFSNAADYTYDNNTTEVSGNSVRLKAQEYSTDANTKGLYHFNDGSGATAADASGNSNDAALSASPSWDANGGLNGALTLNGSTQSGSAGDSTSLSISGQNTLETNFKLGSNFDTNSNNSQTLLDKGGYRMYLNNRTGKLTYELANSTANTWSQVAGGDANGQAINNSWDKGGKYPTRVLTIGTNVYAGLGTGTADAEVYKYNGTTWTKLGGDGVNGSWSHNNLVKVTSMTNSGNTLYVGVGGTAGFGEVWSCDVGTNCTSWTKLGGTANWTASVRGVSAMTAFGGNLYVAAGSTNQTVYKWNGSVWSTLATVPNVYSDGITTMTNNGVKIYVGYDESINIFGAVQCAVVYDITTAGVAARIAGQGIGGWDYTKNKTMSMVFIGANLYVGLGSGTSGQGEIWRIGAGTWNQIGGDGLGTGGAALSNSLYMENLSTDGTNLYVYSRFMFSSAAFKATTPTGTAGAGSGTVTWTSQELVYLHDDQPTAMTYGNGHLYFGYGLGGVLYQDNYSTPIGGDFIKGSWSADGLGQVQSMVSFKGALYAGVAGSPASTVLAPGSGHIQKYSNGSWSMSKHFDANNKYVKNWCGMTVYNGELYALWSGTSAGNTGGIVKTSDGATWNDVTLKIGNTTQVIGTGAYGICNAMGVHNGKLYISNPNTNTNAATTGRAALYEFDSTAPASDNITIVANGSGSNSSWNSATFTGVRSINSYNGQLYAGLEGTTNQGEVWAYNGSAWTKVGSSTQWGNKTAVHTMAVYDGKLYTGVGISTADNAQVWSYDGSTWTKIGGDGANSSWDDDYEVPLAMTVYNGELYTSLGHSANDGEIWKYNGSNWAKIGGDGANSSWSSNIEYARSLTVYSGKLYAGLGYSGDEDAQIWQYGNNGVVESTTTSWDTSWHHVAATYDGATMKLYVDGNLEASSNVGLAVPDTNQALLIGKGYGSREASAGEGHFAGNIDETRISDIARSSFASKPFATSTQTVSTLDAIRLSGVLSWDAFTVNETANGGSINYQLSDDNGATWKYYNAGSWQAAATTAQANTAAVVNTNINTFPVTFSGLKWRAVLQGDGNQQVTLSSVSVASTSDSTAPSANASNIIAKKVAGGATLNSGGWTNGATPYFSWDAGTDASSGIKGYCLYLGTNSSADPVTTKGLLGTSPTNTGGHCQFIVNSTTLDTATSGYLATALTTSSSDYYLNIKAIDNAGNAYGSNAQFVFKFDNTAPANPGFVTAPSQFINTKLATITWPTLGGSAASDANAGVAGLQYRINNSTWYGDSHLGSEDIADLLTDDGSYTTLDPTDFNNINDGINTIYFRTWDNAGNVTNTYVTASLKVNTSGAPSEPQNVVATPASNTDNSFAFSWAAPTTYVGAANTLTYCYTVNTIPSAGSCTFTSAGTTSLPAGAYATQSGANTFYVVARDESQNINYSTYSTVQFSANTTAPGIPTNMDIADVSIKSTSKWRLAVTWDVPSQTGIGIASYKILRSTNNVSFAQVGTSTSTTYIDANLSQITYYYKVQACDSTSNCGVASSTVSMLPTGKFTDPADLTANPTVSGVTTRKATIKWSTNRASDSKIAIGTATGSYSATEIGNSSQVTAHEINLDNLEAGKVYYFKAKWTDEDGNTGTSSEFSFSTLAAPTIKEANTSNVNLSTATANFTVANATKVRIYYGKSESFGGVKEINTSNVESIYNLLLDGLEDGTKYFYKINPVDADGFEYNGNIYSFITPARPRIENLTFQPVEGEPTSTQRINWTTNVPASSQVVYGVEGKTPTEVVTSTQVTKHEIIIRGLTDNSVYELVASSRDGNGNVATSDKQIFRTSLDTRPPKVSDIVVESSIKGLGSEARGQIVVSWKTDEPSTSQVAFGEGTVSSSFGSKSAEESGLSTEHVVVISDLSTSKVYSLQIISKDKSGNFTASETQTTIIGHASDSVLTIIINTLSKLFNWL